MRENQIKILNLQGFYSLEGFRIIAEELYQHKQIKTLDLSKAHIFNFDPNFFPNILHQNIENIILIKADITRVVKLEKSENCTLKSLNCTGAKGVSKNFLKGVEHH